MCNGTIVRLLSVGILCWASLPSAAASLKARDPQPPNGACGVSTLLLSWTPGDTAAFHDVYIGTTPDLGPAQLRAARSPFTMFYLIDMQPHDVYYWRVDEVEANTNIVYTGDVWCFSTECPTPCWQQASPSSGTVSLCCDLVLTWPPVAGATYHVYFSESQSAVAQRTAAADRGITTQTALVPGSLQAGATYYWCVDLISSQGEVLTGTIWSFRTAACGTGGVLREWWRNIPGTSISDLRNDPRFPGTPDGWECLDCFEGPSDWADEYGTRLSAWLLPPASGLYTFWIAGDDQAQLWLSPDADPADVLQIAEVTGWTAPREWTREPGQKSAPILLQAGQKYYIEALGKEGGGNDNLAVAWQGPGMTTPKIICMPFVENPACASLFAHAPFPQDGDSSVISTPILSWQAGREAVQHDIYFGTDRAAVLSSCACPGTVYKGRQSETTYNPGPLAPGTYYWRVDEINPANPASPWRGCVWTFTVSACTLLIEDFENYGGSDPLPLTWVGTAQPVVIQQAVVHSGTQALRLDYDNRVMPYCSEARATAAQAMDWTAQGATTLSLWFHGRPAGSPALLSGNDPSPLYVRVGDSAGRMAIVFHFDLQAVLIDEWRQWSIALQQFAGVNLSRVKEMAIGVGGVSPDGTGQIYIDDICLR